MRSKRLITAILVVFAISTIAISAHAEYVPFRVKLNMMERLIVSTLLPKESNFANWKIINDLKNELAPTEQELKAIDIKPAGDGGITAEWDAVPEKEITFGEMIEKIIVDALKKLDSESKLLPEHISLYEKFVLRGNK